MVKRILVAVVVAVLVVGFVVVRVAEGSDSKSTVVSGPPDPVTPTVMHARPTRYAVVSTLISGMGHLYLEVGTYLHSPKDTIVLTVLDRRGTRIARCVFPPTTYTDNGRLVCPLRDISKARALIVERRGKAKIALYANGSRAGYLVKNESASFAGRVATVLSRVALPLPNGVGSVVLLVSLFGSVALTAFAVVSGLCGPEQRRKEGPERSSPDAEG